MCSGCLARTAESDPLAFIPLYDSNPLRRIRWPWVSWSIIAANVLVYFFYESGGFIETPMNASAISLGLVPADFSGQTPGSLGALTIAGGVTLITYAFLHANFWHLAGNMIFLWVFGDNVEDALGHFRYMAFYLICAAVSGYSFVLADPTSDAPVVGASGAVAGVLAAYLLLYPRAKVWVLLLLRLPVRLRVEYVLGFWIAFQIYSALAGGDSEVAWWVHVGGLATGAVLVVFMRQKGVPLFAKALPEHPPKQVLSNPATAEPPEQLPPAVEPSRGPWE
jgi:membrane associated rhomboid family serine protease